MMIHHFAKNYDIKVTKICYLLSDNCTSVRRIVICWASVHSFKTERIEQVESLEIRVLTPFRLKPKKGLICIKR